MKPPPATAMGEWGSSCGFHLRQVATALRWFLEVSAALSVLSWTSTRLPDALRLSGFFLRRLSSVMVSTPFAFFVGNAIVLTLFVANTKSAGKPASTGVKNGVPTASNAVRTHAVDDYRRRLQQRQGLHGFGEGVGVFHLHPEQPQQQDSPSPPPVDDDVYYEDKAVCLVEKSSPSSVHTYRRTQSDHFGRAAAFGKPQAELRRTVTDVAATAAKEHLLPGPAKKRARGQGRRPDHPAASRYPHHKYEMHMEASEEGEDVYEEQMRLSDEELRRRVEAFIAKQLKFHRDEELSITTT